MKKFILFLTIIGTLFLGSILPATANAASIKDPCSAGYVGSDKCVEQENPQVLENRIGNWIGYGLTAVGVLAVGFLIYGGITFVLSGGDAEKVKKAKKTVLYSLIGLALALLAGVIVSLVINTANRF